MLARLLRPRALFPMEGLDEKLEEMHHDLSEILNDPDIWNLSDSDDEFGEEGKYADRNSEEEGKSAAQSDEEAAAKEEDFAADEQEMARYLVEQAPAFGGVRTLEAISIHSGGRPPGRGA